MIGLFVFSFLVSGLLTVVVMYLAKRWGIVDHPGKEAKNVHKKAIPLLGGTGMFVSIALFLLLLLFSTNLLTSGLVDIRHYLGFLMGGLILMVGGWLDDKYDLPPKITVLFPVAAAAVAVFCGLGISKLTNPFGSGPLILTPMEGGVLTFVWLLVVMYTTKFLDGLDGLATSVSSIGVGMILCLALTQAYFQLDAAIFAAICLGAMLGFLVWNKHPAKIFLGEGGSTFVGFTLGTLAVLGGAKVGMAMLVLSIPLLDLMWVVLRRVLVEHHSPTKGDRKHLHHRLFDLGLSQRQVVLFYSTIAFSIGLTGLFLQSKQKLILFGSIILGMILFASWIVLTERKRLKR